jgi:hypothetical protein
MQDGKLKMKDQLRDYQVRGDKLAGYNFLDFALDTYEGDNLPENVEKVGKGRPRSDRIPYRDDAGKKNKVRIIRQAGHETMPHFVGQWFPRNNVAEEREMYCASMLALLKPWREIYLLKEGYATFDAAFREFEKDATQRQKRIMENIQYYHECLSKAREDREGWEEGISTANAMRGEDGQTDETLGVDDEGLETEGGQWSEEAIEKARDDATNLKELLFGKQAVYLATKAGFFDENTPNPSFGAMPRTATEDEQGLYQAWQKQLKHYCPEDGYQEVTNIEPTTKPCVVLDMGPSTTTEAGIIHGGIGGTEDLRSRISRDRLSILNEEQLRAHTIIENHAIETLEGKDLSDLYMRSS